MGSAPCCEGNALNQSAGGVIVVNSGSALRLAPISAAEAVNLYMPAAEVPDLLQALDGRWYLKGKKVSLLCDVWNAQVFFQPNSALKDTVHLLVQEGADIISLEMNGKTLIGTVSLEAQATITWEHGETWIKQ
mmetsp:Transcript_53970/g.125983  ORF Transcript_53970/g.125983 Transcript_53970/m.125983 type:complete len:133 (+) Transcript_53970:48-446(+)